MMNSTVTWTQGMSFGAELDGHKFSVDADPSFGGKGSGPKPKGLMLTALAGCTGMDVISILQKMKIAPEAFTVEASAELGNEHPKVFTKVHLVYRFKGADLPMDKLAKAVELSQEKYCGVSAMLRKAVPITHEIKVEA